MATYAKPPQGFRALQSLTNDYTKTLQVVYPTARDLAKELDEYTSGVLKQAMVRMDELISTVQKLKLENERLMKEAEEARKGTEEAVKTMHTFLKGVVDLGDYRKGEENKAVEDGKPNGAAKGLGGKR